MSKRFAITEFISGITESLSPELIKTGALTYQHNYKIETGKGIKKDLLSENLNILTTGSYSVLSGNNWAYHYGASSTHITDHIIWDGFLWLITSPNTNIQTTEGDIGSLIYRISLDDNGGYIKERFSDIDVTNYETGNAYHVLRKRKLNKRWRFTASGKYLVVRCGEDIEASIGVGDALSAPLAISYIKSMGKYAISTVSFTEVENIETDVTKRPSINIVPYIATNGWGDAIKSEYADSTIDSSDYLNYYWESIDSGSSSLTSVISDNNITVKMVAIDSAGRMNIISEHNIDTKLEEDLLDVRFGSMRAIYINIPKETTFPPDTKLIRYYRGPSGQSKLIAEWPVNSISSDIPADEIGMGFVGTLRCSSDTDISDHPQAGGINMLYGSQNVSTIMDNCKSFKVPLAQGMFNPLSFVVGTTYDTVYSSKWLESTDSNIHIRKQKNCKHISKYFFSNIYPIIACYGIDATFNYCATISRHAANQTYANRRGGWYDSFMAAYQHIGSCHAGLLAWTGKYGLLTEVCNRNPISDTTTNRSKMPTTYDPTDRPSFVGILEGGETEYFGGIPVLIGGVLDTKSRGNDAFTADNIFIESDRLYSSRIEMSRKYPVASTDLSGGHSENSVIKTNFFSQNGGITTATLSSYSTNPTHFTGLGTVISDVINSMYYSSQSKSYQYTIRALSFDDNKVEFICRGMPLYNIAIPASASNSGSGFLFSYSLFSEPHRVGILDADLINGSLLHTTVAYPFHNFNSTGFDRRKRSQYQTCNFTDNSVASLSGYPGRIPFDFLSDHGVQLATSIRPRPSQVFGKFSSTGLIHLAFNLRTPVTDTYESEDGADNSFPIKYADGKRIAYQFIYNGSFDYGTSVKFCLGTYNQSSGQMTYSDPYDTLIFGGPARNESNLVSVFGKNKQSGYASGWEDVNLSNYIDNGTFTDNTFACIVNDGVGKFAVINLNTTDGSAYSSTSITSSIIKSTDDVNIDYSIYAKYNVFAVINKNSYSRGLSSVDEDNIYVNDSNIDFKIRVHSPYPRTQLGANYFKSLRSNATQNNVPTYVCIDYRTKLPVKNTTSYDSSEYGMPNRLMWKVSNWGGTGGSWIDGDIGQNFPVTFGYGYLAGNKNTQAGMSFVFSTGSGQNGISQYNTITSVGAPDTATTSLSKSNIAIYIDSQFSSLPALLGLIGTRVRMFSQSGSEISFYNKGTYVYQTDPTIPSNVNNQKVKIISVSFDGGIAKLSLNINIGTANISLYDSDYVSVKLEGTYRDIKFIDDLEDDVSSSDTFDELERLSGISYGFYATGDGVSYYGNILSELGTNDSGKNMIMWQSPESPFPNLAQDAMTADDSIIAMHMADNVLWVFTRISITGYAFSGSAPQEIFKLRDASITDECQTMVFEDVLYYATKNGIYKLSRNGPEELTYACKNMYKNWRSQVDAMSTSFIVFGVDEINKVVMVGCDRNYAASGGEGWTIPSYSCVGGYFCYDTKDGAVYTKSVTLGFKSGQTMIQYPKFFSTPDFSLSYSNINSSSHCNSPLPMCCRSITDDYTLYCGWMFSGSNGAYIEHWHSTVVSEDITDDNIFEYSPRDAAYAIRESLQIEQDLSIGMIRSIGINRLSGNDATKIKICKINNSNTSLSVTSSVIGFNSSATIMPFHKLSYAITGGDLMSIDMTYDIIATPDLMSIAAPSGESIV